MGTGHSVNEAKTYTDHAGKAADKMAGWAKEAKKLEDKGQTLDEMQQFLLKLSFASKLSSGIGVVSVGLTIAQVFYPIKSIEQQILDGVNQVKNKIDNLESEMKTLLKELHDDVWDAASQSNLESNHISHIAHGSNLLNSIAARRKKNQNAQSYETKLIDYPRHTFGTAVTEIYRYLVSGAPVNLLELAYNKTYGDPKAILKIGGYYLQMAKLAVATEAAAAALEAKRNAEAKGLTFDEADASAMAKDIAGDPSISSDYAAQLYAINRQIKEWTRKALSDSGRFANVKRFCAEKAMPHANMKASDYQGSSDRLIKKFMGQFPWLNFSTLVYKGVEGPKWHGWVCKDGGRRLVREKYKDEDDEVLNVLVYLAERKTSKIPTAVYALMDKYPKSGPRSKVKIVATMLNRKKRPRAIRFRRYYPTPSVTASIKSHYSLESIYPDVTIKKSWSGDFVWSCWVEDYNENVSYYKIWKPTMGAMAQTKFAFVSTSTSTQHTSLFEGEYTSVDREYYQVLCFYND